MLSADPRFLTQLKGLGSYTIPGIDLLASGNAPVTPGPEIAANYVASNATIVPSLGRPLSGGAANATVNLVAPGTMYGERLNQLDLRVSKIFTSGRKTAFSMDVFNLLNANAVLVQNNNYATWQRPQTIMYARFFKSG